MYIVNGKSVTGPNPDHLSNSTNVITYFMYPGGNVAAGIMAKAANEYQFQLEHASLVSAPVPERGELARLTRQVAENNFYVGGASEQDRRTMAFLHEHIAEPRTVPLMFGVVVIPLTFLGCVYYSWTALGPIKVGGFSWLKFLVLINPLVYMCEGFRAALTTAPHMSLAVVYLVLAGFAALFLYLGINGFKKRVLS